MSRLNNNNLVISCIIVWSMTIFRLSGGGSITWFEPPPFETVTDPLNIATANINLTEGFANEELSWNFSFSAGLTLVTASIKLDGSSVVSFVRTGQVLSLQKGFENRFNVTWVPNKLTLILLNVTSADEGEYRCEVLSVGSSAQTWVRAIQVSLLVQSKIKEISGETVVEGENATLKCTPEGNPPPSLTWTRLFDSSIVTMPLINIRRQDEGEYRCIADNGVGEPANETVRLIVEYKPDYVSLNIPTTKVCAGTAVTFTCSAGAANPVIQNYTLYQFFAGLTNSSSNQVGVFNQTLLTEGLYNYTCEASNSVGSASSPNRTVEVQVTGSVEIRNSKVVVLEGSNITVHCIFSGFHSKQVSWRSASNYKVEKESILKFPNISRYNDGEYNCSASNACGADSKRVYIDVQYPVEASGSGENATVAKGVVKTFSCPVTGNPEPNITWHRGNESFGAKNSYGKQLNVSKEGCYTCVASNSLGTPVNITQCLTFGTTDTTTPSIMSCSKKIAAKLLIIGVHLTGLNSSFSRGFMAEFEEEMDKIYKDMAVYVRTQVTNLSLGSEIDVFFTLCFNPTVTTETVVQILKDALNLNGTFGRYRAGRLTLLEDDSTTSTTPGSPKPTVAVDPPWVIIGAVAGGVVLLAILVGVLTWWVHKQRKCRKDSKIHNADLGRHDDEGGCSQVQGAYAQSGPPAANGTDGAAEQEIEVAGAIPSYAVVDKSRKSKKQADERPPEYAVVDKSKKEEEQGAAAIPTYAAVDKSKKKKKKSREEVPPVYAEVDKSKKKKRKKIDDKNLYENLDEPKKEKKPGELLYADLGDFQNPSMPTVSTSPQPLPAIKKADPYERTDYADITEFLKGNATLPPNDGNGDTEMKPKRPSKKEIQGNDKETPI